MRTRPVHKTWRFRSQIKYIAGLMLLIAFLSTPQAVLAGEAPSDEGPETAPYLLWETMGYYDNPIKCINANDAADPPTVHVCTGDVDNDAPCCGCCNNMVHGHICAAGTPFCQHFPDYCVSLSGPGGLSLELRDAIDDMRRDEVTPKIQEAFFECYEQQNCICVGCDGGDMFELDDPEMPDDKIPTRIKQCRKPLDLKTMAPTARPTPMANTEAPTMQPTPHPSFALSPCRRTRDCSGDKEGLIGCPCLPGQICTDPDSTCRGTRCVDCLPGFFGCKCLLSDPPCEQGLECNGLGICDTPEDASEEVPYPGMIGGECRSEEFYEFEFRCNTGGTCYGEGVFAKCGACNRNFGRKGCPCDLITATCNPGLSCDARTGTCQDCPESCDCETRFPLASNSTDMCSAFSCDDCTRMLECQWCNVGGEETCASVQVECPSGFPPNEDLSCLESDCSQVKDCGGDQAGACILPNQCECFEGHYEDPTEGCVAKQVVEEPDRGDLYLYVGLGCGFCICCALVCAGICYARTHFIVVENARDSSRDSKVGDKKVVSSGWAEALVSLMWKPETPR